MEKMYSSYDMYVLTNMPAASLPMLEKWAVASDINQKFIQENPYIIEHKAFNKSPSKK